jgi:predicted permease
LLVGAGLFIRTLQNLQSVNVGFNQENLLIFALDLQQGGYKPEKAMQFYEEFMERLEALPGVRAATFARIPLISHYVWDSDVLLPGETEKNAGQHVTNRQLIRENYFATMEIPLLTGRAFTPQDDAHSPTVAIVNQTFARQFFPDGSLLGKHVTDPDSKRDMEIIGIVADSKYSSQRSDFEPLLYTSWRQDSDRSGPRHFALRVNGDPASVAGAVRSVVHELDSNLPVTDMSTQVARSSRSLARERLYARLLTFFGGLALALAAIGLSGVLSYSVAQRTGEIGVRMALGAQRRDVLQLVIWQGMKLVIAGLAVGALTGYTLFRLASSNYVNLESWRRQIGDQLLYGVKATDPVTFCAIALLLSLIALGACFLPARRAASVDPLEALREE